MVPRGGYPSQGCYSSNQLECSSNRAPYVQSIGFCVQYNAAWRTPRTNYAGATMQASLGGLRSLVLRKIAMLLHRSQLFWRQTTKPKHSDAIRYPVGKDDPRLAIPMMSPVD
ncbi:hypothetical protein FOXYSP1_17730 [Fusarium oxysporum f. sp. phaseoli]